MSVLIAAAKAALTFIINGGGEVITTGVKVYLRTPVYASGAGYGPCYKHFRGGVI